MDLVVLDGDSHVHKVSTVGELAEFPCETNGAVHILLKAVPLSGIGFWVRIAEPDTNNIINESFVEKEFVAPVVLEVLFMCSIVEGGIQWGWWGPHGCAVVLVENHISKGEEVVAHNEG